MLAVPRYDFKQPLFFDDNVTIYSEIKEIHSKVFLVKHTFHKGHDIIAIGTELRVWGICLVKNLKLL